MSTLEQVKQVLADSLQLGPRAQSMVSDTALLGSLPELDSIAVVNVVTALQEHFGIDIADDEISGDSFATLGALTDLVEQKLAE